MAALVQARGEGVMDQSSGTGFGTRNLKNMSFDPHDMAISLQGQGFPWALWKSTVSSPLCHLHYRSLTSGSSTQVMIIRPQSKSFTTGVDNSNVGRLTCLPTKCTSINTEKCVCVYIHAYVLNYRCTAMHILTKEIYSIVLHITGICYKIHARKYVNSSS